MLFPVNRSYFDMRLAGALMACAAAMVVVFWGPRTLARFKIIGHGWLVETTVGLGILGRVFVGALAILMLVFQFPNPTGPYAIGTLICHWVDATHADIFAADPTNRRELMVQVWYPADAYPASPPAPYMREAEAVTAAGLPRTACGRP